MSYFDEPYRVLLKVNEDGLVTEIESSEQADEGVIE